MRIIMGSDGSPSSAQAVELLSSLPLPTGSEVTLVYALPTVAELRVGAWMPVVPNDAEMTEKSLLARAKVRLRDEAGHIRRPGVAATWNILRARAADAIVETSHECAADLIVLGHRGMGTLEALLLGSVSSEVVDRALCPVLVVRSDTISRAVFGDDGSAPAQAALSFLARWPFLAGETVEVVSVVDRDWVSWAPGSTSTTRVPGEVAVIASAQAHAESSLDQLGMSGKSGTASARVGHPAKALMDAARESRADLIVVGSRGYTGLHRLLLGSVARAILLHASTSVLIVKSTTATIAGERTTEAVAATKA